MSKEETKKVIVHYTGCDILKFGLKRMGFANLSRKNLISANACDFFKYDTWQDQEAKVHELGINTISLITTKECATTFFISNRTKSEDASNLKKLGITAVMNVSDVNTRQSVLDDYEKNGIKFLHVSFLDDDREDLTKRLEQCYKFTSQKEEEKVKLGVVRGLNPTMVLIHCASGINRSAMVTSYCLLRRIYEEMRDARVVSSWLYGIFKQLCIARPPIMINPRFVKALVEIENRVLRPLEPPKYSG